MIGADDIVGVVKHARIRDHTNKIRMSDHILTSNTTKGATLEAKQNKTLSNSDARVSVSIRKRARPHMKGQACCLLSARASVSQKRSSIRTFSRTCMVSKSTVFHRCRHSSQTEMQNPYPCRKVTKSKVNHLRSDCQNDLVPKARTNQSCSECGDLKPSTPSAARDYDIHVPYRK